MGPLTSAGMLRLTRERLVLRAAAGPPSSSSSPSPSPSPSPKKSPKMSPPPGPPNANQDILNLVRAGYRIPMSCATVNVASRRNIYSALPAWSAAPLTLLMRCQVQVSMHPRETVICRFQGPQSRSSSPTLSPRGNDMPVLCAAHRQRQVQCELQHESWHWTTGRFDRPQDDALRPSRCCRFLLLSVVRLSLTLPLNTIPQMCIQVKAAAVCGQLLGLLRCTILFWPRSVLQAQTR